MAKRNINIKIEEHLLKNEPFEYAHLVKFERPFDPKDGTFRSNDNRYVYLTDASRDITFHGNTYIANRLLNVGTYQETVEAKATNMTLTLSGEPLGLSYTVTGDLTGSGASGSFSSDDTVVDGELVDFAEAGFIEGDKIKVSKADSSAFSDGDTEKVFLISGFSNSNKTISLKTTWNTTSDKSTDDSDFVTLNNTSLVFTLDSEEVNSATLSGSGTNPSFLNREVFIYKVFFDPDDLTAPIGANSPSDTTDNSVLVFKGIISSTNIKETEKSSRVTWNLTSHWGDFEQISGRITTDEIHRALNNSGQPNPNATLRPIHATDLGFLHAETSLNTVATYQTVETRYKYKHKSAWYKKKVKTKEDPYDVYHDHDVDLNVSLFGKYLPVVYGVHKLPGIPVFADTNNTNSKEIYVVYAVAEGEIHGLFNTHVDDLSLLCVDNADSSVRSQSVSSSETQGLQCYGRMDRGDTLSGNIGATTETFTTDNEDSGMVNSSDREEDFGQGTNNAWFNANDHVNNIYKFNAQGTQTAGNNTLSTDTFNDAKGLQHGEFFTIDNPYDTKVMFHSGRHDQETNGMLAKLANDNSFKRQVDYYEGTAKYWGPNHRLLDTSYVVCRFLIDADSTTIPELNFTVKGKVLKCYNFDHTYVHDGFLGSTDDHTKFLEGDVVTVEVSNDSPTAASHSWTALASNHRIIDKYLFTNSRGETFYRFRLDGAPNLLEDSNGAPTRKFLRLKASTGHYWHMMTWNNDLVSTATAYPHTANRLTPTAVTTTSTGNIEIDLSNTEESRLISFFGSTNINTAATTPIVVQLTGSGLTGNFASAKNTVFRATYNSSTNKLLLIGSNFTASQTLSGTIYVQPADRIAFDLGTNFTDSEGDYYATGSTIEIVETGEKREIVNWVSGTATLSSAFVFAPTDSNTFKITGKGDDLRASNNPAIQTMDLLTSKFYGKGLNEVEDIDLSSVKASARLCDVRSDVALGIASTTLKKGDLYKLVVDSNHVASGKVKQDITSSTVVEFEEVSGKFMRTYENYIDYDIGDIIYYNFGTQIKYFKITQNGFRASPPTLLGGTGYTEVTSLALTKVSGDAGSPASVSLDLTNARIPDYSLYDSDFVKYWRYLGWEEGRQHQVTRHQTNCIIDTSSSVFNNINVMLGQFNGILSYSNGKYVLGVETQTNAPSSTNSFNSVTYDWNVNPEFIDESDIIGNVNLVDNSQKSAKNTVKGQINDPQNNFGSRSVTFYNSDFLKADRNVIKTGNIQLPGVTNYYNARMTVEKYLQESRFNKEISFTLGPKGLLLKAGEVLALTYAPLGFNGKRFRIKNLSYTSNCNVQVKAVEYDDSMYIISAQRAVKAQQATLAQRDGVELPVAPTSVSTSQTKPGVITVSWTNGSNYKAGSDFTQIWRANAQGSGTTAITTHATLVATVDDTTEWSDAVASAGNKYYWVRHVRDTSRKLDGASQRLFGNFHALINGGVQGTAKSAAAQLDVDVTSVTLRFDASGNIVGGNTAQDIPLTATVNNITPDSNGIVFSIVDSSGNAQSTQKLFLDGESDSNAATSKNDTSSPFKAIIDSNTFTASTPNRFVKVSVTDNVTGDTFSELIPVTVSQDGSSGSIGKDAAAVSLSATADVIVYDANDPDAENPSTQTIVFTATGIGTAGTNKPFTGTPTYTFSVDGGSEVAATTAVGTPNFDSATFTLPDSNEPAVNTTKNVTVFLRDGSGGALKASDSMTIFGIKSGSDAITAFLTNESHVVPANSAGAVTSFTGASGTFKILIGDVDKTAQCTFAKVTNSDVTATIVASGSTAGNYSVTGLTADTAAQIFRVTIPDAVSPSGSGFTIDRTFTIAKSKAGTDGDDGDDGTSALNGILTNENASASVFTFLGATSIFYGVATNGEFKTFSGTSELTSGVTYGISGGTSSGGSTTKTQNNLTMTINNSTGVYALSGISWSSEVESFTLQATTGGVTLDKIYTINKQLFSRVTNLTAAEQAFKYDGNSSNPSPSTIKLTASAPFASSGYGNYTYTFLKSTNAGASFTEVQSAGSSNEFTVSAGALSLGNEVFKVEVRGSNSTNVIDTDEVTLIRLKDGDEGTAGTNNAVVTLYKRDASASTPPAVINDTSTYTFSTAILSNPNGLDGWSQSVPSGAEQYLWSCDAQAVGPNGANTDTITSSEWGTPLLISEAQEPRQITKLVYFASWSRGDIPPGAPSATKFDFSAGTFTNLTANWSTNPASPPYAYAELSVKETVFEGNNETASNQTITSSSVLVRGGKYDEFDPGDIELTFDTSQNRFRLRPDSGETFRDATIPENYRNDVIAVGFDSGGSKIQLTPFSGGTVAEGNTPAELKNDSLNLQFSGEDLIFTKGGSLSSVTPTTPTSLKNATININASGQITGINSSANNKRIHNDIIEISMVSTGSTNRGRLTIDGIGGTDHQVDVTKGNLGLDYFDGANKTEFDTLNSTDGAIGIKNNNAGSFDVLRPFDTTELDKLTNLRAGKNPADNTKSILNNDISISSGNISGIGTGSGTKVDNTAIDVTITETGANQGKLSFSNMGSNNEVTLDIATLADTGSVRTGAGKANTVIDGSNRLKSTTTLIDSSNVTRTVTQVLNEAQKVETALDSQSRLKTNIIDTTSNVARTPAQLISRTDKAETGLDSNGRLKTSIISGSTVVSVADLKDTKLRTFGAINQDNRIIGDFFSGGTTRSLSTLFNVFDSSGNIIADTKLPNGSTFSVDEFQNVRGAFQDIDNSSNIKLAAAKIPFDTGQLQVDSGTSLLKVKEDGISGTEISSSAVILAGGNETSTNKVVGLVGTGSGDTALRIFAGSTFSSRASAPFRVSQAGEVNVTSLNVNTGSSEKTIRFRPSDASNIFFAVGDSDPGDAPLRVKSVSGTSQVEIDNLKLFKDDGTTLMFDSSIGFTDAAFTQIAANVGSSNTGSTVSTISNPNLVNPFTALGGFPNTATTSGTQETFQKVTISVPTTLTVKAIKDANFFKTQSNSTLDVVDLIPTAVKMRIGVSENSNLSSPTYIAELGQTNTNGQNTGSSIGSGVTRHPATNGTGVPSATQYEIVTETEVEPGFYIESGSLVDNANDAVNADDNFEISDSRQYGGSLGPNQTLDLYFFIEVDGSIVTGQIGGAEDVTRYAPRELQITSSGTFSIDSSGNAQPSGSGTNITAITQGTGISVSGSGSSRAIALNLNNLTSSTSNTDGDFFAVVDNSGNQKKINKTNINISGFNNDSNFTSNTGTVTRAFRTIAISGQSNLIADTEEDILTFAAGTNISFTTDASTDTLTINSTASGGSSLPSGMAYSSSILDVTGQVRATGDVTAFYSSDRRFKDNIKVIDNALEKMDKIRGVEFDWNEKSDYQEFGHDIGVIAQEVETAVPEIVIERDNGYKAVNYQKLTALLVQAVKELKEEIKELKKDK